MILYYTASTAEYWLAFDVSSSCVLCYILFTCVTVLLPAPQWLLHPHVYLFNLLLISFPFLFSSFVLNLN